MKIIKTNDLKEYSVSKMSAILYGYDTSWIYNFAIGTPTNPDGQELKANENNKLIEKFKKIMDQKNMVYKPIKGKYSGTTEKSFVIFNINIKTVQWLFGPELFRQESFIFTIINKENTKVEYQYWERDVTNPASKFIIKDKQYSMINLGTDDREDMFSSVKDWKFRIPFNFAENLKNYLDEANEEYKRLYPNNLQFVGETMKGIALCKNVSPSSLYNAEKFYLNSKVQESHKWLPCVERWNTDF